MKQLTVTTTLLLCLIHNIFAQQNLLQYQPTHAEIISAYQQAALMDSAVKNKVFKTSVRANWQADGKTFWYRNFLKDSAVEYLCVNASNGHKQPAFDHSRMAAALNTLTGKSLQPDHLLLSRIQFDKDAKKLSFEMDGKYYQCNLKTYQCAKIDSLAGTNRRERSSFRRSRWWSFETDSVSPDKRWAAYIKDNNVFVEPAAGGTPVQFTKDGTADKPYGSLAWSPDSKYIVGYHINLYKDSSVYYVLSSTPNTTRGQLRSHEYKQPGDPFTTYEMYVFNIAQQKTNRVNTEILDFFEAPELHWRKNDTSHFLYEKVDRGHQRFRIIEVDAQAASAKTILDEKTNTFIYESRIFTEYLPETNEIIWATEKDGWRHLYLVNSLSGDVKPITAGNWVVRNIDSIDTEKREIWFRASGMNEGEDPYNIHYYKIKFDGTGLVKYTSANANHDVVFSPGRKYYIDVYSRPDMPPVSELHQTQDGKLITQLEKADLSAYFTTGIRLPEVFHAKGRDGVTDIWGIICRPSHFDSSRKYPVIENIYAGPQDSFVPKNFMSYSEMQSIAELGFIVVQCDGMGTANRSKAFHDVCWKNIADAGLPDRILWIKAVAAKYPYVDATRVGIYGTSAGGQNTAGALLFHPEFYKAGVAACGCHDNRIDKQWWNEQWMGYPVGKHYDEQSNITNASKLKGNLFLIVAEGDTNVPPESTYRFADALIKAKKDFDFLVVPGMNHSDGGPYGRMKKRDFFVKHLLNVDPPERNSIDLTK